MRRSVAIAMALASIAAFAILIALGTWQVQRLAWKEGLIATIESRVGGQPEALGAIEQRFASGGDVDYWPVTVEGTFRHDAERHYFATWQGQSGYHILTPLELADGRLVFVNRGFVPFDRKDPATRAEGQVAGPVTVTGLARDALAEKPSFIVPDNDPAANIFYWKDLDAMIESAGLGQQDVLPFLVDADAAQNPGGLPVGGVTIIDMPNSHLQYAVTWYGLAAALAGVMAVWLWRSRRREPPAP
jgi:surfeit locus 1 family protein